MINLGKLVQFGDTAETIYPKITISTELMPELGQMNVGRMLALNANVRIKGINKEEDGIHVTLEIIDADVDNPKDMLKAKIRAKELSEAVVKGPYTVAGDG